METKTLIGQLDGAKPKRPEELIEANKRKHTEAQVYEAWLQHPITQELIKRINDKIHYELNSIEVTGQCNSVQLQTMLKVKSAILTRKEIE